MTQIRQKAFSNRIEEYLDDSASFDEKRFDSSLYHVVRQNRERITAAGTSTRVVKVLQGLCFSEHIDLVMLLLDHAYRSLHDHTGRAAYARAISRALQSYAEPLADGALACFPYPHFLLHGLDRSTIEEVCGKLVSNGRIIHETLDARPRFMRAHGGPVYLEQDMKMLMEEGAAEDSLGICCYLTRAAEPEPHGTDCSYIAKASFFLDTSRREIIIITLQGQRVQKGNKSRSREYARLRHRLKMDPRAYILKKICEIGRKEACLKIRVIRPLEHPMFLDQHPGFMARYEPIVRQAGIATENGCYLERDLAVPGVTWTGTTEGL